MRWTAIAGAALVACGGTELAKEKPLPVTVVDTGELVTLSVVGTNDLHGAVERLPYLAGYFDVLRAKRGERLILLDAGDMFQGTLESNLGEGRVMIEAMNAMGYTASCVGNHEFDFGPIGSEVTVQKPGQDPRGALKARAAEARFPILGANLIDAKTGKQVGWKNVPATLLVERDGIKVGIIGLATADTPTTTIAANFEGLAIAPLAETIVARAKELRGRGASVILVNAHAGGKCSSYANPRDTSSCMPGQEIFEVAEKLPRNTVDVIVGGHSHAGVAHEVNGIAIIESFAHARAFGRVDLAIERGTGRVSAKRIFAPQRVCAESSTAGSCETFPYEGQAVVANKAVAAFTKKAQLAAKALSDTKLGAVLRTPLMKDYRTESAAGNWFADQMRLARPKADVAITNGGGLRDHLPAGPLTYGSLYRLSPFDNRFALVTVTGAELKNIVKNNLSHGKGILSLSGVRAVASCKAGELVVELARDSGKSVADNESLLIATSDFLATGGDRAFQKVDSSKIKIESGRPIRDEVAEVLKQQSGVFSADALLQKNKPRLRYPGTRPVTCK